MTEIARSPATLLGVERWEETCASNGRTYRIFLVAPSAPPPPGGYPVLFMTDGNEMAQIASTVSVVGTLTGAIRPALVVGIGYPVESLLEAEEMRMYDLTPPTPADYAPWPGAEGPWGGGDALVEFILEQVAPQVSELHPVDPSDRSLFGHSAGGLLVLHTLFKRPEAFRSYIAASPSIGWNDRAVLNGESAFAAQVSSGAVAPRVLITVGSLEQSTDNLPTPIESIAPGWSPEQAAERIRAARMVDNARELAERLSVLSEGTGLETEFVVFDAETHTSVVPASVSRGIGFALRH
jgi:hypothetical protein